MCALRLSSNSLASLVFPRLTWIVAELVERYAPLDMSVLITGESGSGKELIARAIWRTSPRSGQVFIPLSCAELTDDIATSELFGHTSGAFTGAALASRGAFREAQGGTLFLDEVGELSPRLQGALLRALESHTVRPVGQAREVAVDVRIIAATNRQLASDAAFRQDLYHRLNVLVIHVPPLSDRPEDIIPLALHFLRRAQERLDLEDLSFSPAVERALKSRRWRGNVRELKHTVQRLAVLAHEPEIGMDVLSMAEGSQAQAPVPGGALKAQVDAFEEMLLKRVLEETDGNRSEAARRLGVNRLTLTSKLKKYGIG